MSKRIIVALNISNCSLEWLDKYAGLAANQKIEWMKKRIEMVCQELTMLHPNDSWEIGWEEYGIYEPNSKFISLDTLALFKSKMQELTGRYPNLHIMAGTVAVKRTFTDAKDIQRESKKAEHPYDYLKYSQEIEEKTESLGSIAESLGKIKGLSKKTGLTNLHVVSNTQYHFYGKTIKKYRKRCPVIETRLLNQAEDPWTIFRPGGEKTGQRKFSVEIAGNKYTNSVDICREHIIPPSEDHREHVHCQFVFSRSVYLLTANLYGDAVIHFDGMFKPKIINTHELMQPTSILLYENNMVDPLCGELRGPLEAFYPLELRIRTILLDAISKLPEESPLRAFYINFVNTGLDEGVRKWWTEATIVQDVTNYIAKVFSDCPPCSAITNPQLHPINIQKKIIETTRVAANDPNFRLLNSLQPAIAKSSIPLEIVRGMTRQNLRHRLDTMPKTAANDRTLLRSLDYYLMLPAKHGCILTFFSSLSKTKKDNAVNKVIQLLTTDEEVNFLPDDINALKYDLLGYLISSFAHLSKLSNLISVLNQTQPIPPSRVKISRIPKHDYFAIKKMVGNI